MRMDQNNWRVWRLHYATYRELADDGYEVMTTEPLGRAPVLVLDGLSMKEAIEKAAELGFGHSAHPFESPPAR